MKLLAAAMGLLWAQQPLLIYLQLQTVMALGPMTLSFSEAMRKAGEKLSVTCSVLNEDRRVDVEWKFNEVTLNKTTEYTYRNEDHKFVKNLTLTLDPLRVENSGRYRCEATSSAGSAHQSMWLDVLAKGYVEVTVDGPREVDLNEGETLKMKVSIKSYPPKTKRQWVYNGSVLLSHGLGDMCVNETSETCDGRVIYRISSTDGGVYTFTASNEDAATSVDVSVRVNGSGVGRPIVSLGVVKLSGQKNKFFEVTLTLSALVILLVTSFIVFLYKYNQKPRYEIRWKIISSVNAETNEYIYIDPSTLPYEPGRWERDRALLTLGKTIGSGEFGKVVEARAHGNLREGSVTRVAVKMLKPRAHQAHKEALMSELKIMSHLGRHLNIVNLLGACTREDPILVITEYCSHGDLLNYLRRKWHVLNRAANGSDDFHASEYENLTTARRMESSRSLPPNKVNSLKVALMKQIEEGFPDSQKGEGDGRDGEGDGGVIASDDSTPFGVLDLLSFSEQVARGMNFLALKNCIHRDLAARNVLVTCGRVAKICDFGLARNVQTDPNYVVKGNVPLPVKWMSPESMFQGLYTVQSDVWSYGVLLWEVFSYGEAPYPGMVVDSKFYRLICDGYCMDPPPCCPPQVRKVMRRCWSYAPGERPTFRAIMTELRSAGAITNNTNKGAEELSHGCCENRSFDN